ncbi:hypothetical protein SAMN05878503_101433 [Cereibacter ovatus]|uniref:Flagellar protein FliL n=1 Tax=Cereibacter ovatus TaxID=439529 RepID=A0A285CKB3_9RHOB|nr:hypothetical protein [Cereibacter ovatus]SNX67795.1 hypothetical protein SAMN05878503_101433 [Cereibacter ovatus]
MSQARLQSRVIFGAALAGPLVLFGLGMGVTIYRTTPAAPVEVEEKTGPEGALTYLPLPDPISATIRGGTRTLDLRVTFAVEGERLDMMAMHKLLLGDLPLLMVELTEAVRICDEAQPSLEAFRRALPGVLRDVANSRYGTAEVPDPVYEALITDFRAG